MPREREPEPTAGLFEAGSQEKRIAKLLDRAVEKRIAAAAARAVPKARIRLPGGAGRKAQRASLAGALAKAVGLRKGGREKPSMRLKAKDTGGRSFHFEHTTVTKGQAYTASKRARNGDSTRGMGTARAHLAYIERETAVEKLQRLEERADERALDVELLLDGPALDLPRKRGRPSREELKARAIIEAAREATREAARGREREPADIGATLEGPGKGAAAQTYIEDPAKMRNGEMILSSFGTIGETYEERLRFWSLVEEHERAPDARIQNRLICELPHQSTPEARNAILREFVKVFDEKEIPYHVAVHAPGAKNDSRNFHAHVVFLERPARKMVDPATGREEWDFAITTTYRKKSGNKKTSHPYRRSRDRDLNKKTFVADMRKRFAEAVNATMAPIDASVRFDPRSYKAMGLDVDPMKSVYRITQDRMNDGKLVIQDVEWTRRMVAAKMREAALRRDPDVVRLQQTTKALEDLKKAWPDVGRMNATLGAQSKIASIGAFTRKTFLQVVNHRIALETARLERKVVAKAELEVCREVMDATRPPKVKAARHRELRTPEEQEDLRVLFETAREEHEAVRARMNAETFRLNGLIAANRKAWRTTARTLTASPRVAPERAPERPDPRTGKVMFEPGLAAKAGVGDGPAARRTRKAPVPAPAAAPTAEPTRAPKGPAQPAAPSPRPGPDPAQAKPKSAPPPVQAPPQAEAQARARPAAPVWKAPPAPAPAPQEERPAPDRNAVSRTALAGVARTMAGMVREVAAQGVAFDVDAFWDEARRNPPSAATIAAVASIMRIPERMLQPKGSTETRPTPDVAGPEAPSGRAEPSPATPEAATMGGPAREDRVTTDPTSTGRETQHVASTAASAPAMPSTLEPKAPTPSWDFGAAAPSATPPPVASARAAGSGPVVDPAVMTPAPAAGNDPAPSHDPGPIALRMLSEGEIGREAYTAPSAEHGMRILAQAMKALQEKEEASERARADPKGSIAGPDAVVAGTAQSRGQAQSPLGSAPTAATPGQDSVAAGRVETETLKAAADSKETEKARRKRKQVNARRIIVQRGRNGGGIGDR